MSTEPAAVLEHSPLDESAMSPMVRKATSASAPPQLRDMTARGMAPLPPADLAVALYQLVATLPPEEADVREVARKTAGSLPEAVLQGVLAQPLDARVLDFYARQVLSRAPLLRVILLNAATADPTFAHIARAGSGEALEMVAANEQRLLRHPAIITALYLNPRTRMSVAQRAVELAVRNEIELEGVPSFADVKAAILSEGAEADARAADVDGAFAAALVKAGAVTAAPEAVAEPAATEDAAPEEAEAASLDDDTRDLERAMALAMKAEAEAADQAAAAALEGAGAAAEGAQAISKLPMSAKLRLAAVGNSFARAILVRDSNRVIAMAAIRSPAVNEHEAERYAGNRALHEDAIRYIATQKQFTKRYSIKVALVNNPKCPLQAAIAFLGFLTAKDLRQAARSKGIPAPLAKAAQSLAAKREAR